MLFSKFCGCLSIQRLTLLMTRAASTTYLSDQRHLVAAFNSEHLRVGQAKPDFAQQGDKLVFYNMRFGMYAHRTALVLLAKEIE